MNEKEPPEFDRTYALVLLTAAAKSNNEGAIRLAMQLANANPCEVCGYVHFNCQCNKKGDTAATPKDVGAHEREIDTLHGLLTEVNPLFFRVFEMVREVAEALPAKSKAIDMPRARATIDAIIDFAQRVESILPKEKHE